MNFTPEQGRRLLDIARQSIRAVLKGQQVGTVALDPDPLFQQPAGCFVTLHHAKTHRLRGCVGRLDAALPLAQAVQTMSAAALRDPRFTASPVALTELPELELELSILSPLKPAAGPLNFDLQSDGIYLTFAGRSGCFLPQAARETGWTREQLLDRLCSEKLGLHSRTWQNPQARLFTFTAALIGPELFEKKVDDRTPHP